MSTHKVPAVRIATILPHPNADNLEIIPIPGSSWQCVVQKGTFKFGDLAIYIEPDYLVPTDRPQFAWLKKPDDNGVHRVKPVRLRGCMSFGMLIPLDDETRGSYDMDSNQWRPRQAGDNMMRFLGITRYVVPEDKGVSNNQPAGADNLRSEWPIAPMWHLESVQNYPDILQPGEPVVVTEKVDGTSARYLYQDGTFFVGTRTRWLSPDFKDNYWQVAVTPNIRKWCADHEGTVLYGEIIGAIKSVPLKYGIETGIQFRAFNAYAPGDVWNAMEHLKDYGVRTVPFIGVGGWGPDLLATAEEDSTVDTAPAGHMREGIVIQPLEARNHPEIGNVVLKYISHRYWLTKPPKSKPAR